MIASGVRLALPITKFEELPDGTMLVTGAASSEDLDRQDEVVDYDGTKRAQVGWEGNVREQHNPLLAVGRRVDSYFADDERRWYVKSIISSGASDTQKKVREGILRYYSVGGDIADGGRRMTTVDKALAARYGLSENMIGKTISVLTDWKMNELSLVDVGANPTSEVNIVKRIDGNLTFSKAEGDPPATEQIDTGVPPEPANPAQDEMAMRDHLAAARKHLEAAAVMEVGEVDEHGTYCLEQVVAMMAVLQRLEETKLIDAAQEAIAMATKGKDTKDGNGVEKGVVSYKLDKAEMDAVKTMIDKMGELQGAMKAFMEEHGEKSVEGDDEEDVKPEEGEEKEEKGAKGEAAPDETADEEKVPKKEASASGGKGSIEKAIGGMLSRVEMKLDEMNARMVKIESLPVAGGPMRYAPVEKRLAHGLTPAAAEAADSNIAKAFDEASQSGQPVTEATIRWALAKQAMGEKR